MPQTAVPPADSNLETVFVMKAGRKVEVKLRPITADELRRRHEDELAAAERAQAETEAAEAGSPSV